jgi:hypothetical protein
VTGNKTFGEAIVRRHAVLGGLLITILMPAASAQENCRSVQFNRGQSSATLRGTAPPDGVTCYTFAAGAGQTASIKVTGRNMIISVPGIGDDRQSWTFPTKNQTYKFIVTQEMRSVTPELYTVTLSIK